MNAYPVAKYQQIVLEKLGLNAADSAEAMAQFEALGLVVSSRRIGKTAVPVVTILSRRSTREVGGWNPGGEDGWSEKVETEYPDFDFSNIMEFVEVK